MNLATMARPTSSFQSPLYDFVTELLSGLQADNFQSFRENVAAVSAAFEKRVPEVFQAPELVDPFAPWVEVDISAESSVDFVNRQAEKLSNHVSKFCSIAEAKVAFPGEGYRAYPNIPVNPFKELRHLDDVRSSMRKDLAPLVDARSVMRKEDVDNESPRKRARHKAQHSLPALAPLQAPPKVASTSSLAESLSGSRQGKNTTPSSSNATSPRDSASGRHGKHRAESPSLSQGRSVSALKKRFEAFAPNRTMPNGIVPTTVSEKIQMFGGKRGSMNSQVAPGPISDVAPALAVPKGRASSTCNSVPNPLPACEMALPAPKVAEATSMEAPASSVPSETMAILANADLPVEVEAEVEPVPSQTAAAELPWVAMPPQPAVLLRSSGGSRSVPTFSNTSKNAAPLSQVGSLRSLAEGKSMPICESNAKGKGKTQRRSATFVVPKEGVLCKKPSEDPRLRGKQEQVAKSKSPKAPSPRTRAAASQNTSVANVVTPCRGTTPCVDTQQSSEHQTAAKGKGKGRGRSHRRSATMAMCGEVAELANNEPWTIAADNAEEPGKMHEGSSRPLAEQLFSQSPDSCGVLSPSSTNCTPRKTFPPVPVFKEKQTLEPWLFLRQSELTSPQQEDNYEISDQGDSDPDDAAEARRRAKKHVPRWCENYLEQLKSQADMDPDTVFGSKVPTCDVEDVFPTELYEAAGKARPKRTRGSSQNWGRDRLTKNEVKSYKQKMGQTKGWMANAENLPPATQQLLEGPRRAA